jgi:hypothetical protein
MKAKRCPKCNGLMVDADSLWQSSWGELFEDVETIDPEPKIREVTIGRSCINCGKWVETPVITRPKVPPGDTRPKNGGPAISVARGNATRQKIESCFKDIHERVKDGVAMKFIAAEMGLGYATFYSHFKALLKIYS